MLLTITQITNCRTKLQFLIMVIIWWYISYHFPPFYFIIITSNIMLKNHIYNPTGRWWSLLLKFTKVIRFSHNQELSHGVKIVLRQYLVNFSNVVWQTTSKPCALIQRSQYRTQKRSLYYSGRQIEKTGTLASLPSPHDGVDFSQDIFSLPWTIQLTRNTFVYNIQNRLGCIDIENFQPL